MLTSMERKRTMVKYVVVNELVGEVVRNIEAPHPDEELYAEEALQIMKDDPNHRPKFEYLYLKVGGQEADEYGF